MNKTSDFTRAVAIFRAENQTAGTPQEERLYVAHSKSSTTGTIHELIESLKDIYDFILLHDPIDGCLIVNLDQSIKFTDEKERVSSLPCKIHKTPNK